MSDPTTWSRDDLLHGFRVRDQQLTEARSRMFMAEAALASTRERLAEAEALLREWVRMDGGGGCAPGVNHEIQPCGCDLRTATNATASFLARSSCDVPGCTERGAHFHGGGDKDAEWVICEECSREVQRAEAHVTCIECAKARDGK